MTYLYFYTCYGVQWEGHGLRVCFFFWVALAPLSAVHGQFLRIAQRLSYESVMAITTTIMDSYNVKR